MQRLSYRLTTEIADRAPVRIIKWGHSQRWLPLFLPYALIYALWLLMSKPISLIHLGDPLLSPLGVILRRLRRVPVVVTAHGLDVIYPNPLYQRVVIPCLRRLDRVVCISRHALDECVRRGVDKRRCKIIPPGIDIPPDEEWQMRRTALADRAPHLNRLCGRPAPSAGHVLITVGRLVRRKGVAPFVMQALPRLLGRRDDWIYLVVGDGPERRAIEEAIDTAGLNDKVYLLGATSENDLKDLYALADLFVMPNVPVKDDCEGFGIVSLEARAAGLPVVAADLEGIREAMGSDEGGLLVPPEDYDAFVEAIDHLLDCGRSDESYRRIRESVARRYCWSTIADRYLVLFDRVRQHDELLRRGSVADHR
ncbi:MAG: glycosyltransferase family 4 protein [Anaerolineae bacterium]